MGRARLTRWWTAVLGVALGTAPVCLGQTEWRLVLPTSLAGGAMVWDHDRERLVCFGGPSGAGQRCGTWEWNQRSWSLRSTTGPSPRSGHAMAYDSVRKRVILFGDGYSLRDTWEWDGAAWSQVAALGPICLGRLAMAYDRARQQTVLYGAGSNHNETWLWDGAAWTPRGVSGPGYRSGHTMVYDAAHSRVVLFGGSSSSQAAETWTWDGSAWRLAATSGPPGPRYGAGMAYDSRRRLVVLFGGRYGDTDTWEWNGTTWTRRTIAGPLIRSDPLMAYDASMGRVFLYDGAAANSSELTSDTWVYDGDAWQPLLVNPGAREGAIVGDLGRHRLVLFGGRMGSYAALGDTWERTAAGWTRVATTGPSPRYRHAMAYDPSRGRTVLFGGGEDASGGETWEWDGAQWMRVGPPTASAYHAMAYDSVRDRVVMFGGRSRDYGVTGGQTWEWDGALWLQRASNGTRASESAAMAFDRARGVTILHGGQYGGDSNYPPTPVNETWAWDGTNWTLKSTSGPRLSEHAMAYDEARARIVLFGGTYPSETWEWDGSAWTLRAIPCPPPRRAPAMAYDSIRHRIIMFGGRIGPTSMLGDTWEYDGNAWTQVATGGPSPRGGGSMTYDASLARVVLFGGTLASNAVSNETWEWDGASWQLRSVGSPSGRSGHASVYQASRSSVLLFGGINTDFNGDTWERAGSTWTLRQPGGPSARSRGAMTYDPIRKRTMLFGGTPGGRTKSGGPFALGGTWQWDGAAWSLVTMNGPSARYDSCLAFDEARNVVVLFGGSIYSYDFPDTWTWDGSTWTKRSESGPPDRAGGGLAFDRVRNRIIRSSSYSSSQPETWEWDGSSWAPYLPAGVRAAPGPLAFDPSSQRLATYSGLLSGYDGYEWQYGTFPPTIQDAPAPAAVCTNQTAQFRVYALGGTPLNYQWRKDAAPLIDDAHVSGTRTPLLVITRAAGADNARYDCVVSNSYGSVASDAASLVVASCCASDFNADTSADDFDYFDFMNAFFANDAAADVNGDTIVDDSDYFDFLNAFGTPC
ncbi:MAG: hypothetical protein JNM07_03835 [Phycisphaerae bacterium]|nr:hypothetical protein [Phycisphaerae bacterium]